MSRNPHRRKKSSGPLARRLHALLEAAAILRRQRAKLAAIIEVSAAAARETVAACQTASTPPLKRQKQRKPPELTDIRLQRSGPSPEEPGATLSNPFATLVKKENSLKPQELTEAFDELTACCQYYTRLFDDAPVGYVVLNAGGVIEDINETCLQMLASPVRRVRRQPISIFVLREDMPKFLGHLQRCKGGQRRTATELRLRQGTRPPLPVEMISMRVEDPRASINRFHTVLIDLTRRFEAEKAMHQVQRNYQTLVGSIQGVLWEGTAKSGRWQFTFVSPQAEQLLGYPLQRWLMETKFWEERLHLQDRAQTVAARAEAIAQGKDHVLEYRLMDAQRHVIWVRDSVDIDQEAGQIRLHGIFVNITELKEMERALRQANSELELRVEQRTADLARTCLELHDEIRQRKRLEQELIDITESGRHQRSVDAHGEVGQSLVGISFMMKGLGTKLEKTAPSEANQVERIQAVVDKTMADSQDPALDLAAYGIQADTLPEALQVLANRAQEILHIDCQFHPNGPIPSLDRDVFIQLYHITQEGVVDAVKYSKAKRLDIALSHKEGQLTLKMQHNGHAFPVPLHPSLELGLKLMRYRAKLIGASVQLIEPAEGHPGLICVLPNKSVTQ